MSTVRLAVVGAGNQCTQSLMPAVPSIPELDLVAVCDLKRDLAERNARAFGARAVYTEVSRMLRDGEEPYPGLRDGWRNLVVGRCILESCAGRQAVEVPQ